MDTKMKRHWVQETIIYAVSVVLGLVTFCVIESVIWLHVREHRELKSIIVLMELIAFIALVAQPIIAEIKHRPEGGESEAIPNWRTLALMAFVYIAAFVGSGAALIGLCYLLTRLGPGI